MIRFRCTCQHLFESDDNMAGGLVQCPQCGKLNDIPTLSDLAALNEDGTYRVGIDAEDEPLPDRLAELERAFARKRVDEYGAEIDLRPSMQDIQSAGADEVPLELKDEGRPGAPKYDPGTGELIRPMSVQERTAANTAVPAIPVGAKPLKYADSEAENVVTHGWEIFGRMFTLPNIVVMFAIFLMHVFLQIMTYAVVFIFILLVPAYLFAWALLIAHYANVIDETGPEVRDELPRPLRNVSWHDDMWGPFFNVMVAFGFTYGPGLACLLLDVPLQVKLALCITLCLIGTLLFPAILLTTTTSGTVLNLRPDRLIGVARTAGASYLLMICGWLFAIGLYVFAVVGTMAALDSFFGGSPGNGILQLVFHWAVQYPLLIVAIYVMHAYAWYLGLIYRRHHADFPWVLQRYAGRRAPGTPAPRQGFAVMPTANAAATAAAQARQPKMPPPRVMPRPVQVLPEPPENAQP
jgi:hypothetical protein